MGLESSDLIRLIEKRQKCMENLVAKPQSKQELVDGIGIPRSTLDNIVQELNQANLVEYVDGEWKLTNFGKYAFDTHLAYQSKFDSLTAAAPVIKELPHSTSVDIDFLLGADSYPATSPVPDEIIQVFLQKIEPANDIRLFTPIAMAGYVAPFYQRVTSGSEYQLKLVSPIEVCNRIRRIHPNVAEKMAIDENIKIFHGEIHASFLLWIADSDHTGIIVFTDNGISGVIINDTDDAFEWAKNQFSNVKKNADRLLPECAE